MKKSKTPPPFSDEMQLLSDACKDAIRNATTEGELMRIKRMYNDKVRSIKECSKHYALIKKTKLRNKDTILILISAAVKAFLLAKSISHNQRINRSYRMKLKALVDLSRL